MFPSPQLGRGAQAGEHIFPPPLRLPRRSNCAAALLLRCCCCSCCPPQLRLPGYAARSLAPSPVAGIQHWGPKCRPQAAQHSEAVPRHERVRCMRCSGESVLFVPPPQDSRTLRRDRVARGSRGASRGAPDGVRGAGMHRAGRKRLGSFGLSFGMNCGEGRGSVRRWVSSLTTTSSWFLQRST